MLAAIMIALMYRWNVPADSQLAKSKRFNGRGLPQVRVAQLRSMQVGELTMITTERRVFGC